ncbi:two-component system chemotaxis sensor kinase CheA [Bradyrhizobium sp. LM6.11]
MDDLLREFLTETGESLDTVDNQLVKFEQEPNNAKILDNIFRLVHTIKGTCGFLGLPRLEALAHAGETLMGKFRDGMPVTGQAVTVILSSIDRIKEILAGLEATEAEPEGTDRDLIEKLEAMVEHGMAAMSAGVAAAPVAEAPPLVPEAPVAVEAAPTSGALADQTLERPLRLGEVSLDELERAFRETAIEAPAPAPVAKAEPAAEAPAPVAKEAAKETAKDAKDAKAKPAPKKSAADETASEGDRIANQSIRVNVDTLEHLMTMVSELVLTRNQLLEISRRNEDTEFKVPLQRLSNVTAELQERRHEDAHAADRQCLAEAAPHRPRPLGRTRQADRAGDARCRHRARPPGARPDQGPAHPHGAQLRRPWPGDPGRASRRRQGRAGHHPPVRLSRGRPHHHLHRRQRPRPQHRQDQGQGDLLGSGHRGRAREDERSPDPQVHLRPGLLDRGRHHLGVGPRRRHGRGAHQYRDQIGGTIDIKSVAGEGSSVTIKIPLTLAIVSALIVEAAGDRFAIPQLAVVELVRARANSEHRIERIKDTAVLRLRNKLLPLIHLKKLLKIDDGAVSDPENGFIVVTQVGSQTFGIVVDGVFHTEEIVVKPMSTKLRHIDMFSGNTILGDGAVIMIIDPNGIAKALGAAGASAHDMANENGAHHIGTGEQTTSLLVFRAGSSQPKAVPLGLVTRLEELPADKIEFSNGRYMVQYREQLMPLVAMESVTIASQGAQPILVFSDDGRSMGLVVDEIIDIVEERLNIEVGGSSQGILGSAVIKGQATEVIDVGHFLPMAFADWFTRKEMKPSLHSQSVLLVDDSAFFRNMLAPVLKAAGYRVRTAPTAQEGLAALRAQTFDVVLTDIEMPDMNGFEFAEVIRSDSNLGAMPIIGLSALVSPAAIERGRQAGFHDYVAKFDRPGLIAALKEQTAGAAGASELSRAAA